MSFVRTSRRVYGGLLLSLLICCSTSESPAGPDAPDQDQGEWPEFTGPYLGQTPPGLIPRRFVPDALAATTTWFHHGSPVFSPDGEEMFFVHYPTDETTPMEIRVTELVQGRWTEPQKAPFASNLHETAPFFSIDGNKLFFVSEHQNDRYKVVTRSGDGWSNAQSVTVPPIPSTSRGWQISVARDETLYFELSVDEQYDLFSSTPVNGSYSLPVSLGNQVNSEFHDFAPYIHPDGEYVIFTSQRPDGMGMSDLWISFRDPSGDFAPPMNMGAPVNTSSTDAWPYVTPDGEYFFFVSTREGDQGYNPYWVDAQIIAQLRSDSGH